MQIDRKWSKESENYEFRTIWKQWELEKNAVSYQKLQGVEGKITKFRGDLWT